MSQLCVHQRKPAHTKIRKDQRENDCSQKCFRWSLFVHMLEEHLIRVITRYPKRETRLPGQQVYDRVVDVLSRRKPTRATAFQSEDPLISFSH